ncbi:MAG: hypothetical protein WB611_15235 [Stellaceae bacterium]
MAFADDQEAVRFRDARGFAVVPAQVGNPDRDMPTLSLCGGVTLMAVTPFPSETIEDDLDDPRMVGSKAI